MISTSTSVVVQSLHPHYTYACAVSAYTVGSGPYSEVLNVTTAGDGMYNYCDSRLPVDTIVCNSLPTQYNISAAGIGHIQ